ncbi:unnamed protein product [Lactuca virosa]|uniref:BHLH domain-containing protein n=1 Tax=Lactuca virosa TaxID=75947 RepID=A0AAU9LLC2_9ASTR|nr:unnamed protein product [Lactuca virosa]
MLQIDDSLGYEAVGATKIPIISRNPIQAQDHMDKASVLEDASIYIKELQDWVKELEGLSGTKRKNVQEFVMSIRRSRLSTSDDEYYSSDETNSKDNTHLCKLSPEIEVQMSGSSVLANLEPMSI